MKKYIKLSLFGLLTWLIPFIVGFFFYTREGVLLISPLFFKSIMIAISSLLATILLVQYFKKITSNYVSEGITIGLIWLAINILLDIIVLVPMAKMTFINYFSNIGLSYVMIPAMSIAVGFVSENAKTKK
ncbi:MAG: hypothetical protein ABR968_09245 [Bacteroidales bacterium]